MDTPILVYHQIGAAGAPGGYSDSVIPLSKFERQMRYLHDHGYRCVSVAELLRPRPDGATHHTHSVVLTFDDGYESFLTQAYPVLERFGFMATVFLVPGYAGQAGQWEGASSARLMTLDQVKTLAQVGVCIGSHTWTHPRLLSLPDDQIRHQMVWSKQQLEEVSGQPVSYLAYPYGESNSGIRAMAVEAGYEAAFGVVTSESGLFNLWRRPCKPQDSLLTFATRLTALYASSLRLRLRLRDDATIGAIRGRLQRHHLPGHRRLSQ